MANLMLRNILVLLVLYQLKHFICDYLLQGRYMIGKFKPDAGYIWPLAAHGMVHAMGTTFIAILYFFPLLSGPSITWDEINLAFKLGMIDFAIHCVMDRIKAAPHYWGRWKSATPEAYKQATNILATLEKWAYDLDNLPRENPNRVERPMDADIDEAKTVLRDNNYFWLSLGFDQLVHHLTHYYLIYRILVAR